MIHYAKKKLDQLEHFGADVISDRKKGGAITILTAFLSGLSYIFSFITQLRFFLYKNRILKSRSLGCLVVVVGNLTVGGTGKTPVVEKFARSLAARGRKVAILSRGYKSKPDPLYKRFFLWLTHAEPTAPKVVSDGKNVLLDSEVSGDEPFMLASNLPGVIVLVDKDRVKAGRYAIEKFGVDTLILDDGFQYLRLKGRLNLLLIDKTNPFGNGHLLPRGNLREPIKHLRRASYVFLTKSDGVLNPELEATIKKYHPKVEIIECAHKPQYLKSFNNSYSLIPIEELKNKSLAAFSGIAVPESFEQFLLNLGAILLEKERFVDHHRFTQEELNLFFDKAVAAGAELIVTTEKDAVRLPNGLQSPIPLYFLRLEIEILKGDHDFEKAISEICFPKNEMRATRIFA